MGDFVRFRLEVVCEPCPLSAHLPGTSDNGGQRVPEHTERPWPKAGEEARFEAPVGAPLAAVRRPDIQLASEHSKVDVVDTKPADVPE